MRVRRLLLLLATTAAAHSAAAQSVTVRPGESLWTIAQRHDTTVEGLMAANGLRGTTVNPGTVLTLPADAVSATTWTVREGDTLYAIARETGATVEDLVAWNDLAGTVIQPGQELRVSAAEPVGAPAAAPLTIEVGPGDTLWRIARAHDTTPAELAAANGIAESATLHPGDTLVVPGALATAEATPDQGGFVAPTITVDAGDTLWNIARRYDTTVAALMAANGLTAETLRAGQELRVVGDDGAVALAVPDATPAPPSTPRPNAALGWPLHGDLTSHFGWRPLQIGGTNMHYGIDIDGDTGDPIVSATAGVVTFAGWMGGFGQLVVIEHGGAEYYYAHASELLVTEGQTVQPGQLIARVGTTGRVTGSHLHFEVRVDGSPIDPLPLFEARTAGR